MKNAMLIGKKIYLRPLELEDVTKNYLSWINDHQTVEFLDSVWPKTEDDLIRYVRDISDDPNYIFFAVILGQRARLCPKLEILK